jgi:hypothetical protein
MFGISQVVPAIRSGMLPLFCCHHASRRETACLAACPSGGSQKLAACFARRVKRVTQKYWSFRKAEVMI